MPLVVRTTNCVLTEFAISPAL